MNSDALWFAKQARFLDDPAIVELGEQHGPGGPLVIDALLGMAKLEHKGGIVTFGYTALARRTFLGGGKECREIIENAGRYGIVEVTETDEVRCTVRFPRWEKWQSAYRQQRYKDRHSTVSEALLDRQQTVSYTEDREQNGLTSSLRSDDVEPARLDAAKQRLQDARELFEYWQQRCGHPNALFGTDRQRRIVARLKEKPYDVAYIKQAIDGAAEAPFVDERGKRHDDIELICRTSSKLEDFHGRAGTVDSESPAAVTARINARNA